MAKLNNIYIFVISEDTTFGVSVTEHTVETGVEISDHVKRNAVTLSISGEIVGKDASDTIEKIKKMHQGGTLCKYAGRTSLSNCLITEFSIGHSVDIWGGCEFSMTLKEVKTASTSYKTSARTKSTKKTGTQQVAQKSKETYVYHTVKKGDTIWALVAASNAPYKNLKRPAINGKSYSACDWVIKQNPNAFSRPSDPRTMQVGRKLNVGLR